MPPTSDHLRLLSPAGRPPATVDIVFVHGLDGDWRTTWRHENLAPSDEYGWPVWLDTDLKAEGLACNVHSFDYPAASSEWRGSTLPMFDRAGNFLEELDLSLAKDSKLFFICHSLGGLMVKRMLSLARDKSGSKARIPERTAGVLFLGTPHEGSGVAKIMNTVLPKLLSRATVTMKELERDNPELRALNETFVKQAGNHGWHIHQFAEGRDTFKVRIVDEHSANSGVGDLVVADEDHITLPKVVDRPNMIYKRTMRMLKDLAVAPSRNGSSPVPDRAGGNVPAKTAGNSAPPPTEASREELAEVFARTVEAIETALNAAPGAAKFLGPQAPAASRFTAHKDGRWEVAPAFRQGRADVCPVLVSLSSRLRGFTAPRHEWDALEQIVGGIIVLGLDPRWVWHQRQILAKQAVPHPKFADTIQIDNAGKKAQFLAVIAGALVGGCARLERVFGPLDPKRIPDIDAESPGVMLQDRVADMQRHFIRYVLGPTDELDVEALAGEQLAVSFRRAEQHVRNAACNDEDPFIVAGKRMAKLEKEIKQDLGMADLYLFMPSDSGSEFDLMTDPVIALTHLKRIHTIIQTFRPNT